MNKILGIVSAALLALIILVPVAAAAGPVGLTDKDQHVVINTGGDITFPAGQHADVLLVVNGTATIEGDAEAVYVFNGTANLIGSQTGEIVAIQSHVTLDSGSVVDGNVRTIDSTVESAAGASVGGTVKDLASDLPGLAALVASALFLMYVAFVVSAIVAGLALAGLAGKQVREAGALITHEPVMTFAAGLVGLVGITMIGTIAIVTIIGAPLGIGILALVLPALLVAGYLVGGIWIGDMILARTSPAVVRERPYLAAVIGVAVLGLIGIVPFVGGVVILVGFGAIVLMMGRTLRRPTTSQPVVPSTVAPSAG